MSGVCIGGSGIEMSSIAIVSLIPGVRSSLSGSEPCGWSSAWRMWLRRPRSLGSESGG